MCKSWRCIYVTVLLSNARVFAIIYELWQNIQLMQIFSTYNVSKRIALNDVGSSLSTRSAWSESSVPLAKTPCWWNISINGSENIRTIAVCSTRPRPTDVFNAFVWHYFVIVCFVDLGGILVSPSLIHNCSPWKTFPWRINISEILWYYLWTTLVYSSLKLCFI